MSTKSTQRSQKLLNMQWRIQSNTERERERWAHSFVTARALSTILCMINQKKNSKFQTKEVFSLVGMNQSEKKKRNRKAAIFSSVSGLKSDKWISGTSAILAVHKKKVGQRYFIPERRDREWQRVTRGYLMLDDSLMCRIISYSHLSFLSDNSF